MNGLGYQLDMEQADVWYYPHFFVQDQTRVWMENLLTEINWQQRDVKMFGKSIPQPRLISWHGDSDASYTYSGLSLIPAKWVDPLPRIKMLLENFFPYRFNSVLLNLYRDERDSMGWHSDDESELGSNPIIASVSLGATRRLHFKHKHDTAHSKVKVDLEDGSLLLMKGKTQHYWKHQLPKTQSPKGPRINLTFRKIYSSNTN